MKYMHVPSNEMHIFLLLQSVQGFREYDGGDLDQEYADQRREDPCIRKQVRASFYFRCSIWHVISGQAYYFMI